MKIRKSIRNLFLILMILLSFKCVFGEGTGTGGTVAGGIANVPSGSGNVNDHRSSSPGVFLTNTAAKTAAALGAAKNYAIAILGGIPTVAGAYDTYVSNWGDLTQMFGLSDPDDDPWVGTLYELSDTLSPDAWTDNMCEYIRTDLMTSASSFVITEEGDQAMHIEGYKLDYEGYVSCDSNNESNNAACKLAFGSNIPCSGEGLCGTNLSPQILKDNIYMITFQISGGSSIIKEGETLQAVIKLDGIIMDISGDWKNGTWNNQNDIMHIKSGSEGYKFGGTTAIYIPEYRIGGGTQTFEKACICILDQNKLTEDVRAIFDEVSEGGCLCNPFYKKNSGLTSLDPGFDQNLGFFSLGLAADDFDMTKTSTSTGSSASDEGSETTGNQNLECESQCIK